MRKQVRLCNILAVLAYRATGILYKKVPNVTGGILLCRCELWVIDNLWNRVDRWTLGRGWRTLGIRVTARNVVKIKVLPFGTLIPASPRHEEKWEHTSISNL
jgi:hypothetical protein